MDKRRLQKTGGSSLIVTLPKPWVQSHHLTSKDVVIAHRLGSGGLLLKPAKPQNQTTPRITLTGFTKAMITRELVAWYIAGVNEIEFISDSLSHHQRQHIHRVVENLIGFEVIDETATKIVVKNLFDAVKFPIPHTIEKMFRIATSMFTDALTAAIKEDHAAARDIMNRDHEIDKLFLVVKRQFHILLNDRAMEEELGLTSAAINYYMTIALRLERIADHAVKVAQLVLYVEKNSQNTMIRPYLKITNELIQTMQQIPSIIQRCDKQQAHALLVQCATLAKKLEHVYTRIPNKTAPHAMMRNSLQRLCSNMMNMAEACLDQAIHLEAKHSE